MMACGAFSPERALAISTCFFAMTTGATDVTVKALTLGDSDPGRPWKPYTPQRPLTLQRDRLESSTMVPFGVVETSQPSATRPKPGSPQERPNSATVPPMCCGQPTSKHTDPVGWYRRSVPTVGNPTTHRMVSRSVPSGTDLHPCAKRKPTHRPWCRRSVPSVQLPQSDPTDGIAEASQPWQPNPAGHDCSTHPSHGIAEAPRAIRPARCKCLRNTRPRQQPTCPPHDVAEASQGIGQPTCACR